MILLSLDPLGRVIFSKNYQSTTSLLSGPTSKSWYLYDKKGSSPSCIISDFVLSDNTYTFFTNGTFEFDHGTLTEEPSCDDCCSDLVNLVGTWKLTKGEMGLRIIALHEKNNPSNVEKVVLFDAMIEQLDENVLRLTQVNPKTKVSHTFEFRKK